ncbi:MAG: serine/threonine-protein kinase [Mycolicibacterium insubricum]|nr:protein kinase [Mycobacterium sp.]
MGQPGTGAQFGPYRLTRLLGRGGFGEVYEAEDIEKGRLVALKLMSANCSQDPVFRERLFREARTAGRLNEPHVVPIHAYGEIDGRLYIDMRLIRGRELGAVLSDGPLEPRRAVWIVRQIASALDAAHAAGLVHRDVKPGNILVTDDDFACLVDFGLATAATDPRLTATGNTIGTLTYMAPERFTAPAELDHRADVYALACVLFECLTGAPPYPSTGDMAALMGAHLSAPIPRPGSYSPDLTVLDGVIATGLTKVPADRYSSAGALARAAADAVGVSTTDRGTAIGRPAAGLAETGPFDGGVMPTVRSDQAHTLAAEAPPTRLASAAPAVTRMAPTEAAATQLAPTRPTGRRRWGWVAGLVALVVAVVAVGAIAFALRPQPPEPASPQIVLPFAGLSRPAAVAVDGRGDVFAADTGNARVLKLATGSGTPVEVVNGVAATGIAVGGDDTVYLVAGTRVIAVTGDQQRDLPFAGLVSGAGIAVDAAGAVYVGDAGNSDRKSVRVLKLAPGATDAVELPFDRLTDTDGIAVNAAGAVYVTNAGGTYAVVKLAGGAQTKLPPAGIANPAGLALDSSGRIYVSDPAGRVLRADADGANATELPFQLDHPGGIAVGPDGAVYVADTGNNRVVRQGSAEWTGT